MGQPEPSGLTLQQRFFKTFGYLVFPGLLADEIDWVSKEFEAVWRNQPRLDLLFEELAPHLSETGAPPDGWSGAVREVVAEIQQRIERFEKGADQDR